MTERKPKTLFSEEDRLLCKELLEQGHSFAFIAQALGREASVVRRWAVRLAMVHSKRPWDDKDKAAARKLLEDGVKPYAIAEALGRSANSVYAFMSRIRAETPPPKPAVRRDPYIAWMIAQEYLRRRVDRSVNSK